MTKYEAIQIRRSVRKYDMGSLSQRELAEIGTAIAALKPLRSPLQAEVKVQTREQAAENFRLLSVKAPYYAALYAEKTPDGALSVGYMGEQLALFLTGMGLGTCWVGTALPRKKMSETLSFFILIAFGRPLEPDLLETSYTHQRKPVNALLLEKDPPSTLMLTLLEAARLAPSAVNHQPCRYLLKNNAVALVRKKLPLPALDRMAVIGCGIALAHMDAAAQHMGRTLQETDLAAYAQGKTNLSYVYGMILQ